MIRHQLLAIDEGLQRLSLIDTANPKFGWTRGLQDFPGARDMQRIGPNEALISFERGFFELSISSGEVLAKCDRWSRVTAARRLVNGATLVAGVNLNGSGGINLLTLDREYRPVFSIRRDGDHAGMLHATGAGTYLLCLQDHVLETDARLVTLRTLRAPGFDQTWQAERLGDGATLVSGGAGAFMARFDARGYLVSTFGGIGSVPDEVAPNFYAAFQVLADGRVMVANWQGPGADNGRKGRQLLEFSRDGRLLGSWSDADKISSLQGILIL